MSKTSKEICTSVNSDAIDAITEGINRVGIDSELQICANCDREGSDVTNSCNKCNLVKYCNAACKKKHRHKHKKKCERRVAEIHDENLFKQPPTLGDCPICFLMLPYLGTGKVYMACCGKVICNGCIHAFQSRATKEEDNKCPFCRTPPPNSNEKIIEQYEKRMELSDTMAIYNFGCLYAEGRFGLPQNNAKALELWHRAGELGHAGAYCCIGNAYMAADGVERDVKKAVQYWEMAAINGDVEARYNLGFNEGQAGIGNKDRALKHFMIAAKGGCVESLEKMKVLYSNSKGRFVTKDDYTKALRSYQAYLDEIKSEQRDEAAAADDDKYYESAF